MQDDASGFGPIRAILLCVEQTEVSHVMHFVIRRDDVKTRWSFVVHVWIKLRSCGHEGISCLDLHPLNIGRVSSVDAS